MFPVYKMIDTCASEFDSYVPYFYSTYERENESIVSDRKKIVVLGSADPHRSGRRVRLLDRACHMDNTRGRLRGYNHKQQPRDRIDRLHHKRQALLRAPDGGGYDDVIELERPEGVIVSLGGQTAINLAKPLADLA